MFKKTKKKMLSSNAPEDPHIHATPETMPSQWAKPQ